MDYLAHHGTKGMKWGVRRYQNPDGSLTAEGRKRYGVDTNKYATENVKEAGRRSAKASAKASFKGNVKRSAALAVAGAALGAASLGSASIGALPLVGAAAGSAFVADMATNTALGAIMGRTYGRKAAHQQDLEIQNHVKNGESFVLENLTATATSKTTWYGSSVKIKTTSEKMRSDDPDPSKWKKNKDNTYEPTDKLSKQPKGRYVQVPNKKTGKSGMVRIEDKAGAALTLGWQYGYNNSEIASILGISEAQLKKELSEYKYPVYNGGIGVGKISSKNKAKKS